MNGCGQRGNVAAAVAICALLAACGGGGNSSGNTGGGGTPPTTAPVTTPTPGTATGSGLLVDHDSGAPLGGIAVALAGAAPGAAPVPQGTTAPNGRFGVTAKPGTYLLVIGSNLYPDPNDRPTIHDMISLAAGSNALTAPNIGPAPGATPNAIEHSGNFRLTTLTASEKACIAFENSTRASHSLGNTISDEWLTEDQRGYWMVATATNSAPQDALILTSYDVSDGNGATCADSIQSGFGLGNWEESAQLLWFAGESGGAHDISTTEGMFDPRGPLPAPTPLHSWP